MSWVIISLALIKYGFHPLTINYCPLSQILCNSSSPEEAHVCIHVCLCPDWDLAAVLWFGCSSRDPHLLR